MQQMPLSISSREGVSGESERAGIIHKSDVGGKGEEGRIGSRIWTMGYHRIKNGSGGENISHVREMTWLEFENMTDRIRMYFIQFCVKSKAKPVAHRLTGLLIVSKINLVVSHHYKRSCITHSRVTSFCSAQSVI